MCVELELQRSVSDFHFSFAFHKSINVAMQCALLWVNAECF